MNTLGLNRWTLLGLALCAGLGWALLQPLPQPTPPDAGDAPSAPGPAPAVAAAAPAQVPLSYYQEVWQRPLFAPDRTPPEETATAAVAPSKMTFTLEGIVIDDAIQRVLVRTRLNQMKRLALGEEVDGWALAGVDQQGATFERGGKSVVLNLKELTNIK